MKPAEAGCWIDGHYGQYGSKRLVTIAEQYGYVRQPPVPGDIEYWEWESERAEEWMNDHVAPEGFSFGWYAGEWFLWSQKSWEEEA